MTKDDMHEYQRYCVQFIKDHPACGLFLEMGLGKSCITLTAIDDLLRSGDASKVLVVAPLRVARDTWPNECVKWEHLQHLKVSKILGDEKKRIKAIHENADIYIVNRENVDWLVNQGFDYDMVVLDELSSFKSSSSDRFKAMRRVRKSIKRIVGLTGTPAPNGLEDLWAQIYLLDKGERLGRFNKNYLDAFFIPNKMNGHIIYSYKLMNGAEQLIYDKISDICVSMKSHDYIVMPERMDNIVEVDLSADEMKQYKKLERDAMLEFNDSDIDAANAAVLIGKLLQMANGAVYDENGNVQVIHDNKLNALEDLIEAANGKPVLVFYYFKHDRDRIMERLRVRELKTEVDMLDWNTGEIPVAIAHPASTGHGLNLQDGGSTVIWFSLNWSLELYQQANARLWRQGQKETVVVHHIISKGTIDEQVISVLKNKQTGQKALIDALRARRCC